MSRSVVLVLGVCVLTAHSAFYKTQDAVFSRIPRSPHGPPPPPPPPLSPLLPPPPPPIVYHTQNWSGISKGVRGIPQGVFSGAAASAQSAFPADSEAFSIASSGTGPELVDGESQFKEKMGKSGHSDSFESNSNDFHRNGGKFSGYGRSEEDQHNLHHGSKLDIDGTGPEVYESQSSQHNAGSTGFNAKFAGGASASHSSGQYKSKGFERESGQRSVNSNFGSGSEGNLRQNVQYGYSSELGLSGSRDKFGSGYLNDRNSVKSTSADSNSQSGNYNSKLTNKEVSSGSFSHSGQYESESPGFGGSATASSGNQFRRYNDQSSESNYQSGGSTKGFQNHNGGVRREFEEHGDSGGYHSYHHDNIRRPNGGQINNNGQNFRGDGQDRFNGFSSSQSSSFSGNYGSEAKGSGAGFLDNQGQERLSNLDAGLSASEEKSQHFYETQKIKQGNLQTGVSANQAGSQGYTDIQNQASNLNNGGSSKGVAERSKAGITSDNASEDGSGFGALDHEDQQSTFNSALNLASQGLQTVQRTPCSSCDKNNYALSNAKSHSGSAIALSIGG